MKLPSEEQIVKVIESTGRVGHWKRDGCEWENPSYGIIFRRDELKNAAQKIISLIKETQFDGNMSVPEVDPNLVRIAELEAKLAIYEAVINGAGIKLAIPSARKEKK